MTPEEQEKEAIIEDLMSNADEFVEQAIKRQKRGSFYLILIGVIGIFPTFKMINLSFHYLPLLLNEELTQELTEQFFYEMIILFLSINFLMLLTLFSTRHFSANKIFEDFIEQETDQDKKESKIKLIYAALERKVFKKE